MHSDRGSQFASLEYRQALAAHQLVLSMSCRANGYDNAFIESFLSSLKYEAVYHRKFANRADARALALGEPPVRRWSAAFGERKPCRLMLDIQAHLTYLSSLCVSLILVVGFTATCLRLGSLHRA